MTSSVIQCVAGMFAVHEYLNCKMIVEGQEFGCVGCIVPLDACTPNSVVGVAKSMKWSIGSPFTSAILCTCASKMSRHSINSSAVLTLRSIVQRYKVSYIKSHAQSGPHMVICSVYVRL